MKCPQVGQRLLLPKGATVFQDNGNPNCWTNPHTRLITVKRLDQENFGPAVGVIMSWNLRVLWESRKGAVQWARFKDMRVPTPMEELAALQQCGGKR